MKLNINYKDISIQQANSTILLGVEIDSNYNWSQHVDLLKDELHCYILKRLPNISSHNPHLDLAAYHVACLFRYGIWCGITQLIVKTYLQRRKNVFGQPPAFRHINHEHLYLKICDAVQIYLLLKWLVKQNPHLLYKKEIAVIKMLGTLIDWVIIIDQHFIKIYVMICASKYIDSKIGRVYDFRRKVIRMTKNPRR